MPENKLLTGKDIEQRIFMIRGCRVMVDFDLAVLYCVPTKRLNEQVKRNRERFPEDFMFQLTAEEKAQVVANCDHLKNLRFSPVLPYAFTEYGAIMAANILNSANAIHASIAVVRVFARLREMLQTHKDLALRLDILEKRYDSQFKNVFDAIRELMSPPDKPKKRIGFTAREKTVKYSLP